MNYIIDVCSALSDGSFDNSKLSENCQEKQDIKGKILKIIFESLW